MLNLKHLSINHLLILPAVLSLVTSEASASQENDDFKGPWDFALPIRQIYKIPAGKKNLTPREKEILFTLEIADNLERHKQEVDAKVAARNLRQRDLLSKPNSPAALTTLVNEFQDPIAAYKLAQMYEQGKLVISAPQIYSGAQQEALQREYNQKATLGYYHKASTWGHTESHYKLGVLLIIYYGDTHIQYALDCLKRAALDNHLEATYLVKSRAGYLLGTYELEKGKNHSPLDVIEQEARYKRAAHYFFNTITFRNCGYSKIKLAEMYRAGLGCPVNPLFAFRYFLSALSDPLFSDVHLLPIDYMMAVSADLSEEDRIKFLQAHWVKFKDSEKQSEIMESYRRADLLKQAPLLRMTSFAEPASKAEEPGTVAKEIAVVGNSTQTPIARPSSSSDLDDRHIENKRPEPTPPVMVIQGSKNAVVTPVSSTENCMDLCQPVSSLEPQTKRLKATDAEEAAGE